MKFATLIAIALPLLQMVSGQQGACERIRVRKEVRDLSPQERHNWIEALRTLYLAKMNDGYNSYMDWFAYVHIQEYDKVHSNPQFLPWHRYFLYILQELVNRVDESVTIPYWDWARDSQAVQDSPVLSDDFIGGNGDGGRGWDLTSGPFGNMNVNWPSPHNIKRCYHDSDNGRRFPSNRVGTFPDTVRMNSIVNSYDSFSEFAWTLELYHGFFHVLLGDNEGDLGPPQSPNDPGFFLHHGNIDRYWWQWQRRDGSKLTAYDGAHYDPPKSANVNDMMSFAGSIEEVQVNYMFRTEDYPFCYTYADNSRQMLDAEGGPQALVNGTSLNAKTITFDKIKDLGKKIKEGALQSAGKPDKDTNNKDSSASAPPPSLKTTDKPKIKPVDPLVILGMAENMNMQMDSTSAIEKIKKHNEDMNLLTSLEGFNKPVKK